MKEDDEPALRKRLLVLGIVFIFCLGTVAAANTPIVEQKKVVKKPKKHNVISGYFKPSIKGTGYSYRWHYKTWINKCAYCGHHLLLNPKKVPERELTCSHCDADFEGVQGYVKNGKKNKKLRKA